MQCHDTRKVCRKGVNDIMAKCKLCNTVSNLISKELGVCLECIREKPEDALPIAMKTAAFGLLKSRPKGLIHLTESRIPPAYQENL